MPLCFFEKSVCYELVLFLKIRYLYEYWNPNDRCKFMDISIYKISEDHSVAVIRSNHRLQETKVSKLMWTQAMTLKPWKWNYYSIIRKSLGLKVWIHVFFKSGFTRTQEAVFLIYYLSLFLPFHVWNWFGKQFLTWETNLED